MTNRKTSASSLALVYQAGYLKKPIRFGVLLVATVKITVFMTLAVITVTD
jgi:hypothetical protein